MQTFGENENIVRTQCVSHMISILLLIFFAWGVIVPREKEELSRAQGIGHMISLFFLRLFLAKA